MDDGAKEQLQSALGRAVKERRDELGLTQEQLANGSDLHQRWISNVESGRRNVSLWNLRRLAIALKITKSELMRRTEGQEGRPEER